MINLALALTFWLALSHGIQGDEPTPVADVKPLSSETKAPTNPVPPLSPQEALERFVAADGFRVELVASEPMIESPVALTFDGDGRIWVVEMRGYMPNYEGTGEDVPNGRIVILEDTDDDGVADTSKVFLDNLVLPRAIAIVKGGVLYCTPPNLIYVQNHNDTPGKSLIIDPEYAKAGENPEHRANGLIHALDNWIYNAKSDRRYRLIDDTWVVEKIRFRGQWGLAQDDEGRLYHNNNSTLLLGDFVPPGSMVRNPNFITKRGVSNLSCGNFVQPLVETDVNRGYQPNILDEEGKLAKATGCCGQTIYRGDNFPPELYGDAFIPEPCGYLLKRISIEGDERGRLAGSFPHGDSEFLASDDLRFRPVNAYTAPDGTLYLIDFYRGLIQHKHYLTDYLRGRLEEKGLDQPIDTGRIWRVVSTAKPRGPQPRMRSQSGRELVAHLAHPNGWWRDTAQQILVQRGDDTIVPELEALAVDASKPLGRMHALWTLEGLQSLRPGIVFAASRSEDPRVLRQATRVAETLAGGEHAASLLDALRPLATHADAAVRLQLALTLGRFASDAADTAQELLLDLLIAHPGDDMFRDAAISGLAFREAAFLDRVRTRGHDDPKLVESLEKAAANAEKNADKRDAARHEELASLDIDWSEVPLVPEPTPVAAEERTPERLYASTCMSCHMQDGHGAPYLAPPLAGSEWVNGPPEVIAHIALHGVRGPINVKGERYTAPNYPDRMPGLAATRELTDEDLAEILTFVRSSFGNDSSPVGPEVLAQVRRETSGRVAEYTSAELTSILRAAQEELEEPSATGPQPPEDPIGDQTVLVVIFLVIGLGIFAWIGISVARDTIRDRDA